MIRLLCFLMLLLVTACAKPTVAPTVTVPVPAPLAPAPAPITKVFSTETITLEYPSKWGVVDEKSSTLTFRSDNADIEVFWLSPNSDLRDIMTEKRANSERYKFVQQRLESSFRQILATHGTIQEVHIADRQQIGQIAVLTGVYEASLLSNQQQTKRAMIVDFICAEMVMCGIVYVGDSINPITEDDWMKLGDLAGSVQIHPQEVDWPSVSLSNGHVKLQYPSTLELTEQREDRIAFGNSIEILLFYYYSREYEHTLAQLIETKESNPRTWRNALRRMRASAREWTIVNETEVVEEKPLEIRTLGHELAICKESLVEIAGAIKRPTRMLSCNFDCSEYICGINYFHFGEDELTSSEWEMLSQFADYIQVD